MENEWYFRFTASLIISGEIDDFEELTNIVGVSPVHAHRKGEKRSETSRPYPSDLWRYTPKISKEKSLSCHLNALWSDIGRNCESIKALKEILNVSVFCGYRSDCDHAGFEVEHKSLEIFQKLEVPFSVSVIVIPPE